MEQVTHRVNEDRSRPFPCQRLFEALWPQSEIKTILKWMSGYTAKAFGKPLCVTIVAATADLRATRNRIPRRVRPLYCALIAHTSPENIP